MKPYDRQLFRAASRIQEAARGERQASPPCELPELAWQELGRAYRLLLHAQRQGWPAASEALLRNLHGRTLELQDTLLALPNRFLQQLAKEPSSLRSIYEDLLALEGEFEEVRLDLREQQLSVVTAAIELEDVALGRFEIRLHWPKILLGKPYEVLALDPNPAATSESTTHPHVQSDALCEGEGRAAIRAALQQGRLLDFFVLVRQILETYNPGSAYLQLSNWSGLDCSDCGYTTPLDDSHRCDRCGSDLCSDCTRSCGNCGDTNCSACNRLCPACECDHCESCLTACARCGDRYCAECITQGQCTSCREREENDEEESDETPAADRASPQPAVQAAGLGQAGVSA